MSIDDIRTLPCWTGEIRVEPLTGGLSNESWKVTDAHRAHAVRFGRDYPFHHVDRTREVMTARAAHATGFAPEVTYAAPGVMVSAFVEARTWDAADLRAAPERIAELLEPDVLVPARDVGALARAITALASSPERLTHLSAETLAKARAYHRDTLQRRRDDLPALRAHGCLRVLPFRPGTHGWRPPCATRP